MDIHKISLLLRTIIEQIEYCKKRNEIFERRERETAYQARLEWNRLLKE
jgi:hypothetical protein